jgi:hypothetical protein
MKETSDMKHLVKLVSAGALTIPISMFIATSSSIAQTGNQSAGPNAAGYSAAPPTANSPAIDDATLKQAAQTFAKVKQITQREKTAVNDTQDEVAKQKILQQAQAEKVSVVKAAGMEPQRYDQILQTVQADTNLQQKFFSYVDQPANSANQNM